MLAVALTFGVGLGSAAIAEPGDRTEGRGGVENRRPSLNFPRIAGRGGPDPAPPPGAVAALERSRAAAARGEHTRLRVYDPRTGDMARYPDGSFVWDDETRTDPKTGELLRNPDGSLVLGPLRAGRDCPMPDGTPKGCDPMTLRRIRRAALLVSLALLVGPVSTSQAATQQASGFRVIDARCSWGQTWVTTDWGTPGLESVATMDRSLRGYCDDTSWVAQAGEIAVGQDLIAWDARGWEFRCNAGPWVYNTGASHEAWTSYRWYRPCNTQWYRGDGFAARRYNGAWQGHEKPPVKTGWVFTG